MVHRPLNHSQKLSELVRAMPGSIDWASSHGQESSRDYKFMKAVRVSCSYLAISPLILANSDIGIPVCESGCHIGAARRCDI
jgi:hypothetical protein